VKRIGGNKKSPSNKNAITLSPHKKLRHFEWRNL
jgi:hypothetical protein